MFRHTPNRTDNNPPGVSMQNHRSLSNCSPPFIQSHIWVHIWATHIWVVQARLIAPKLVSHPIKCHRMH